jgi:putative chitinase
MHFLASALIATPLAASPWQAPLAAERDFGSQVTEEQVAALFPKRARRNVFANWPLVQRELRNYGLSQSRDMVIYALATIRVETGTFSPAPELPSSYSKTLDRPGYAGIQASGVGRPFGAYDSTIRFKNDGTPVINKNLGNCYYPGVDEQLMRSRQGMPPRPECEDGIRFRGRGFIQLTGKYNYEQMQKQVASKLSTNIIANPDDAGKPEVAAKILAVYLANNRTEIEGSMHAARYADARRVVNAAALGLAEFTSFVKAADKALK